MDPFQRVQLRVVRVADIRPHEIADPYRKRRIEARLQADGVLRDPLVVGTMRDLDGYLLLDGTNRLRALEALGLPSALVQVIDYADPHAVQLRTWCHAVRAPLEEVLTLAGTVDGLTATPLSALDASRSLLEPNTFAVLLDGDMQYVVKRTQDQTDAPLKFSRFDQLQRFVQAYEERMTRVDCAADDIEWRAQVLAGSSDAPRSLVAFPPFTPSLVAAAAMRGAHIPAGITRHLILVGRALRVNLPLTILSDSVSLEAANIELLAHLAALQPRFYGEPTVLFDS